MSNLIYGGLVFAQLFTFCAYVVVSAGAALLQKKANTLTLFDNLNEADMQTTLGIYNDVFQSTTYIVPYPMQPKYQFQYQWWIIEYEFAIFVFTAALTIFPRAIPRAKIVALTFLATALVLVMDNVNAIWSLLRSDLAKTVFDAYRIRVAQAGLLMVGVSNGLTIIFMGLYERPSTHTDATITMTAPTQQKPAATV